MGRRLQTLDETELEIEQLLDAAVDELPRPVGGEIGTVSDNADAKLDYLAFLKETVSESFAGYKVVLDCANGSAYELAPTIFRELGRKSSPSVLSRMAAISTITAALRILRSFAKKW